MGVSHTELEVIHVVGISLGQTLALGRSCQGQGQGRSPTPLWVTADCCQGLISVHRQLSICSTDSRLRDWLHSCTLGLHHNLSFAAAGGLHHWHPGAHPGHLGLLVGDSIACRLRLTLCTKGSALSASDHHNDASGPPEQLIEALSSERSKRSTWKSRELSTSCRFTTV